jgi:GT2 family glycosyltransferase
LRLAGWGIGVVPSARATHDYDFAKGDYKWFLLERNRWWTVLGVYPTPLLVALLPALLALELVLLAVAWRGGWLRAKLRAQAAVVRQLPAALRRRRAVQRTRRVTVRAFAAHLEASLDSPFLAGAEALPVLPGLQAAYWRAATAALRRA